MSESHWWYLFHKEVKSWDSTTWFRILQFQTPAWKRYLQMHLPTERFIFWGWSSRVSERGNQRLSNSTNVASWIVKFCCLHIYSLWVTQIRFEGERWRAKGWTSRSKNCDLNFEFSEEPTSRKIKWKIQERYCRCLPEATDVTADKNSNGRLIRTATCRWGYCQRTDEFFFFLALVIAAKVVRGPAHPAFPRCGACTIGNSL